MIVDIKNLSIIKAYKSKYKNKDGVEIEQYKIIAFDDTGYQKTVTLTVEKELFENLEMETNKFIVPKNYDLKCKLSFYENSAYLTVIEIMYTDDNSKAKVSK